MASAAAAVTVAKSAVAAWRNVTPSSPGVSWPTFHEGEEPRQKEQRAILKHHHKVELAGRTFGRQKDAGRVCNVDITSQPQQIKIKNIDFENTFCNSCFFYQTPVCTRPCFENKILKR